MTTIRSYVLVVDDDPAARAALQRLLATEGISSRTAEGGHAALEIATREPPEIVVTDLRMPEMDGIALLEELLAHGVDAPVLVATGVNDVSSAVRAIRAGAADYLTKPIDADALLFAFERALATRALEHEARALRTRNEQLAMEAERNLHAREELLSILAHDLRAPLASIQLAATAPSLTGAAIDPERRLAMVERAASRMQRLVDDLLDVARIESGALLLDFRSQRVSTLLAEAAIALGPDAEHAHVRLETDVEEDFTLLCAIERIVQVLVNLGANAIHASKPGARVRIVARGGSDHASFSIIDEGGGITPETRGRLFERGARSPQGGHHGAGLGLVIVKGIVDAHGGTISVESAVGRGTTFRVEIPNGVPDRPSWRILPLAPSAHPEP